MLVNCGMSQTNYDNSLIGWDNNASTPSGRSLGANGLTYCLSTVAHDNLFVDGWTFSGDAQDCSGTLFETDLSGAWNTGSTWVLGFVPPVSGDAVIKAGHDVTLGASSTINELDIEATASLSVSSGNTLTFTVSCTNNGIVQGGGEFAGSFTNAATGNISPGASPGCLTFTGDLTNDGTITIEVDGSIACTEYDQVISSGTITLGGTLDISVNYSPADMDEITFVDATAISGTFANLTNALPNGWTLEYDSPNAGEVSISYEQAPVMLVVEGEASKATAGDWLANSDARLKTNIESMNSQEMLDKMLSLKGVTYEWDDKATGLWRPKGTMYGFIAQNIQEVFPDLVKSDEYGFLQTSYGTYDAMTVEAIRALQNQIRAQQNVIAKLQGQLNETDELKNQMADMQQTIQSIKAELPAVKEENVGEEE